MQLRSIAKGRDATSGLSSSSLCSRFLLLHSHGRVNIRGPSCISCATIPKTVARAFRVLIAGATIGAGGFLECELNHKSEPWTKGEVTKCLIRLCGFRVQLLPMADPAQIS